MTKYSALTDIREGIKSNYLSFKIKKINKRLT